MAEVLISVGTSSAAYTKRAPKENVTQVLPINARAIHGQSL